MLGNLLPPAGLRARLLVTGTVEVWLVVGPGTLMSATTWLFQLFPKYKRTILAELLPRASLVGLLASSAATGFLGVVVPP